MVSLELTESELVFLQRLIGHHLTSGSSPNGLYDKIADKTDALGITNNSPLNLVDASKDSWYFTQGDNRLLIKLMGDKPC